MNNKTLSIVSYITIIGWLIAYFSGKETADNLLKYHLRQSLGLFLITVIFNIIAAILIFVVKINIGFVGIAFLILAIIGIINASNEVEKPLPIIGKFSEGLGLMK